MNKQHKQLALLLILLVLPIIIFGFLKIFGENQFQELPIMSPEANSNCPTPSATAYTIPSFELTRSDGSSFTQENLNGEIYIAAFIDMQCDSRACTEVGLSLYRIQERFKKDYAIKILAHTTNPQADSLPTLQAYGTRLEADPNQWYLTTSSTETLTELGRCGYGLIKTDSLTHTPWVALVDGNAQIRGFYDASDREDVNRLLTEGSLLLLHSGKLK